MKNPLRNIFHSRDKPPDEPTNAVSGATVFSMGRSIAGTSVNERSAMQMTTVFACVRVLAETLAALPLHVYHETDAGRKRDVKHPLYRMLHDEPNSEMTSFVFRETLMSHLSLWGNAYAQIIRNGAGRVVALYPLLPEKMKVDRDSESNQLIYDYTKDGIVYRLSPQQVLHIPGLGFDGIMGHSPIAVARNAIGLGIAAENYGSRFFENNALPSGVLLHPGKLNDPQKLREAWQETHGGKNNSKTAVLEEGMKFQQISMPNDEAQFLESRKFQTSEICRIFRVPPHMVGDLEKATFSNIEHQAISFAVNTMLPWVVRWEQSINRALFSESEKGSYFVAFNMDGLQRGDYKTRMEGYAIGRQNGWWSTNDIREMENQNPISEEEGGNIYAVNGNMVRLADLGKNAANAGGAGGDKK